MRSIGFGDRFREDFAWFAIIFFTKEVENFDMEKYTYIETRLEVLSDYYKLVVLLVNPLHRYI